MTRVQAEKHPTLLQRRSIELTLSTLGVIIRICEAAKTNGLLEQELAHAVNASSHAINKTHPKFPEVSSHEHYNRLTDLTLYAGCSLCHCRWHCDDDDGHEVVIFQHTTNGDWPKFCICQT